MAKIMADPSLRSFNLGSLDRTQGICKWCLDPFEGAKQRHYCSSYCSQSANIYCWPQTHTSKAWRFIEKQDCSCLYCGEVFLSQIEQEIAKWDKRLKDWEIQFKRPQKGVQYHHVGSSIGSSFHLDHIIPLFKGGHGLDPKNLQVICATCHDVKTKIERKGFY